MRKYPTYKDSGVQWIGEIPEHWEVKRLKFTSDIIPSNVDKKSKEDEDEVLLCNYVDVYKNDFITDEIDFMKATASEAQITKLELRKFDVIATKDSEDPFDIGVPALVRKGMNNIVCGYHLTLLRSFKNKLSGYFLYWFICSDETAKYFSTEARGVTRFAIGSNTFKNLKLLLPPLPEQNKIAAYLDHKTAQLDNLIAKKERLIELLQEERTAIINQAVTKGINPNAPMKDSGIKWLGKIPEHWLTTRINRVIKVKDGTHDSPTSILEGENTFPLITSKDFDNGKIVFKNSKHISAEDHHQIIKRSNTQKGDIIMSMIGGNIGNLVHVNTDKEFSIKNVCLFKTYDNPIAARYLYFILKSSLLKIQIDLNSRGGAQGFLSLGDLRSLIYFVMPIDEMKNIVDYIERVDSEIDNTITKTQQEIELLQEYKTALISEVVTGKIDVREEVLN